MGCSIPKDFTEVDRQKPCLITGQTTEVGRLSVALVYSDVMQASRLQNRNPTFWCSLHWGASSFSFCWESSRIIFSQSLTPELNKISVYPGSTVEGQGIGVHCLDLLPLEEPNKDPSMGRSIPQRLHKATTGILKFWDPDTACACIALEPESTAKLCVSRWGLQDRVRPAAWVISRHLSKR